MKRERQHHVNNLSVPLFFADLILQVAAEGQSIKIESRIYRGGYWRNEREDNQGAASPGTIAFYDGKGRYKDRKSVWRTDIGELVHGPFVIQSGNTKSKPTDFGWYGLFERREPDFRTTWLGSDRPQIDHTWGPGKNNPLIDGITHQRYWQQGSYCQWKEAGNRTTYTHYGVTTPPSIHFKFELVYAWTVPKPREFLQIHPDGFNDGTAGCVGMQRYNDCCKIFFLLRHYSRTSLQVLPK